VKEKQGGKGYLRSEELAFTLSTRQDQNILQYMEHTWSIQGNIIGRKPENGGHQITGIQEEISPCLTKTDIHGVVQVIEPIAFGWQNSEQQGDSVGKVSPALDKSKTPAVMQPIVLDDQGGNVMNVSQDGQIGTLRAQSHQHEPIIAIRYGEHQQDTIHFEDGILGTLPKGTHENTSSYTKTLVNKTLVRRLTPKECGRLQGFPDGYLEQVPGYSDSKAYSAFGNSMTVQVMEWLGKRIELVDNCLIELEAANGAIARNQPSEKEASET
jgi:DNA (cytosine-5)-methyltransferase 1